MNLDYEFNNQQFNEDVNAIKDSMIGFVKSFGFNFGPKKIKGKKISFFEEYYTRFRLSLVEMGISKLIRTGLVLVVGLIVLFAFFLPADRDWRFAIGFLFLLYVTWQFMADIDKSKDTSWISGLLFIIYDMTVGPLFAEPKKK